MNHKIFESKRKLKDILKIKSDFDFHKFFIEYAINQYISTLKINKKNLGTILVLGANEREAKVLPKYNFQEIVLSGISESSKEIKELIKSDPRIQYKKENIESISAKNKSFDIVFCKESLHHLPRPVLGFYEMLRVCKKAVVFIEPNETFLGNFLEILGISSRYEKNQKGNLDARDNFVYRWRKKEIEKILSSYYLESGWKLFLTTCWVSNSKKLANSKFRKIFFIFGWLIGFFPFSKGNYLNALIVPGSNLPPN